MPNSRWHGQAASAEPRHPRSQSGKTRVRRGHVHTELAQVGTVAYYYGCSHIDTEQEQMSGKCATTEKGLVCQLSQSTVGRTKRHKSRQSLSASMVAIPPISRMVSTAASYRPCSISVRKGFLLQLKPWSPPSPIPITCPL